MCVESFRECFYFQGVRAAIRSQPLARGSRIPPRGSGDGDGDGDYYYYYCYYYYYYYYYYCYYYYLEVRTLPNVPIFLTDWYSQIYN